MTHPKEPFSLPQGICGALTQQGIEESEEYSASELNYPNIEEVLALLQDLFVKEQVTITAYSELAHALGQRGH